MEDSSTRSYSSSLSLTTSEVISGIDDTKQDSVPAVVSPPPMSSAKQRNASDSAGPSPRLASLTELLMRRENSTSSDPSPSIGFCFSSATVSSSSDQTPIPCPEVRTSSRSDGEDATGPSDGGYGAHRRPVAAGPRCALPPPSLGPTTDASPSIGAVETDLRRLVFRHSRAKRLVSGLRVHAFTRQAFVSSFTVGLVLGSVIAILLKILRDLTHRVLYG